MKSKIQKREEGKKRNAAWRQLTREQQIAELDRRGVAATRQRQKLTIK